MWPSATRRASRCFWAPPPSNRPKWCRRCSTWPTSPTRCSTRSSTTRKPPSWPSPDARARSPWPPTWPAVVPTSCSAATSSSSPTRSSSPRATRRTTPRRNTRSAGLAPWPRSRSRSRTSTRRSSSSAVCTCSAPNATSPVESTTSCVAVPAVRAIRANPAST